MLDVDQASDQRRRRAAIKLPRPRRAAAEGGGCALYLLQPCNLPHPSRSFTEISGLTQ